MGSHAQAATLCETTAECVERIEWTEEVAESNCPDGYSNGDKGWGTAKDVRIWSDSAMVFMRELTFCMGPASIVRWQIACSYRAVRNVFMTLRTRESCINGKKIAG